MTKREYYITNVFNGIFFRKYQFYFYIDDMPDCILLSPTIEKRNVSVRVKYGNKLDGMQIIYFKKEQIFEVSEFQAGKNENELHIFTETRNLNRAIKSLLKGNKRAAKIIWDW